MYKKVFDELYGKFPYLEMDVMRHTNHWIIVVKKPYRIVMPARLNEYHCYKEMPTGAVCVYENEGWGVKEILGWISQFLYEHPGLQHLHISYVLQEKVDKINARLDKLEEALLWHPNSKNADETRAHFEDMV
nr:hypothetical protein K-LCC10_0206 [Kaumoebavirus]